AVKSATQIMRNGVRARSAPVATTCDTRYATASSIPTKQGVSNLAVMARLPPQTRSGALRATAVTPASRTTTSQARRCPVFTIYQNAVASTAITDQCSAGPIPAGRGPGNATNSRPRFATQVPAHRDQPRSVVVHSRYVVSVGVALARIMSAQGKKSSTTAADAARYPAVVLFHRHFSKTAT